VSVQTEIERKLGEQLSPSLLEVTNESSMHSVAPGSETHFKVLVVSPAFAGQSPLERHRMVYAVLADELKRGVHALTITSRTPDEWEKSGAVASSPPCLGGSKSTAS
jgi:BolA protein